MRSFRFLLLLPLSVELTMLLTVLFFAFAPPKSMLHNLCALSLSILANNIFHMLSCPPSCLLPATCASPSDDVTGHAISMCSAEHTLALSLSHTACFSLSLTRINCCAAIAKLATCQPVKISIYPIHVPCMSLSPCQVPNMGRGEVGVTSPRSQSALLIISIFSLFLSLQRGCVLNAKTMSDTEMRSPPQQAIKTRPQLLATAACHSFHCFAIPVPIPVAVPIPAPIPIPVVVAIAVALSPRCH